VFRHAFAEGRQAGEQLTSDSARHLPESRAPEETSSYCWLENR